MYRYARGFTLIELIIVVAIIAILSTIGLTVYSGIQRGARDAKRQSDIQEIQKALEQFYALNRYYPGANSHPGNLTTLVTAPNAYFPGGAIPEDPLTTSAPYQYLPCATADRYVLCTGAAAMETCTTTQQVNCNASATAPGCGQFTSTGTRTLYCVGSLSN